MRFRVLCARREELARATFNFLIFSLWFITLLILAYKSAEQLVQLAAEGTCDLVEETDGEGHGGNVHFITSFTAFRWMKRMVSSHGKTKF